MQSLPWAVGRGMPSSQYLTDSEAQHLPLQRNIRFTASLTHSVSPDLYSALPPPSLLCHCCITLSPLVFYNLSSPSDAALNLNLPFSSSLIFFFSLFHSFSVYTEECSMWKSVALWLLILATLLRGEWLSLVLWVILCSNKCVFSPCAAYKLLYVLLYVCS